MYTMNQRVCLFAGPIECFVSFRAVTGLKFAWYSGSAMADCPMFRKGWFWVTGGLRWITFFGNFY